MDEIMKQVEKQIGEVSDGLGLYYFSNNTSPSGLPYLDIYTTRWKRICRVELLDEMDKYQITPHDGSSPRKVGKDILLTEVLKELWRWRYE